MVVKRNPPPPPNTYTQVAVTRPWIPTTDRSLSEPLPVRAWRHPNRHHRNRERPFRLRSYLPRIGRRIVT